MDFLDFDHVDELDGGLGAFHVEGMGGLVGTHSDVQRAPGTEHDAIDLMNGVGLDAVLEHFDDDADALFALDHSAKGQFSHRTPISPSVSGYSASSSVRRADAMAWVLCQEGTEKAMFKTDLVPAVKQELVPAKEEVSPPRTGTVGLDFFTTAESEVPLSWSREDALKRYRAKRERRSFKKVVRYDCRKKIAASRPRVGGRFARRGEMDRVGSVMSLVTMSTEQ